MTTIAQAKTIRIPASRLPMADRLGRRLLRRALPRIESGRLTLIDDEDRFEAGGRAPGPNVELTVLDSSFYSAAALGGSLGAAESYMDGAWRCDDLAALIELLTVNYEALQTLDGPLARMAMSASRIAYALQRNSRTGSRRNIKAHYDLSNEFFELFLDPSMTYSCGVFERADASLEEAQVEKIDRACRKLRLQASDHLLEIGTGWGSAAIHAASKYGCRVTTTTISDKQFEYASRRVRERGLGDRVSIVKSDYRALEGQYDKALSIEMIEAVGKAYLDTYFAKVSSLLKPDGLALIQAITIRDQFFASAAKRRDFLKKYIFPGSCLLSVTAMCESARRATDMRMVELEDIGPHYVETLQRWRSAFLDKLDDVRALGFDDRFIRMWEYYLCYCEGAFRARHCSDVQALFAKPRNRSAPDELRVENA